MYKNFLTNPFKYIGKVLEIHVKTLGRNLNVYCLLFRQKIFFFIHSKLSQISISFKILSKNILMGFSMIVNQKKIWWIVDLWKLFFQEADPDYQCQSLMTSKVIIKVFMINGILNALYPVRSLELNKNTWTKAAFLHLTQDKGQRLKDILLLANYRSRSWVLNLFKIGLNCFFYCNY